MNRGGLKFTALVSLLIAPLSLLGNSVAGGASPQAWPQLRFDGTNSGVNPAESTLSTANVATVLPAWSSAVADEGFSLPVVANGLVYVACPGALCAYHESDGGLLWKVAATQVDGIGVLSNTVVFVDGGLDVVAVDALTGAARWRTKVSSADDNLVETAPIGASGSVFVGTHDDRLVALSLTTGSVLWSNRSGPGEPQYQMEIWTQPALVNGTLYVSESDQLRALRASDGAVLWRSAINPYFDASGTPTVVGTTVYMSNDGTVGSVDPPEVRGFAIAGCGKSTCPPTVTLQPANAAFSALVSFPDDPSMLYGYAGTTIVAFNARTGAVKWTSVSFDTFSYLAFPELVGANGVLYLSDGRSGRILAFSARGCRAAPCEAIWAGQIAPGDGGPNGGDPVIADGTIYVTGSAVYAYRLPSAIPSTPEPPAAPTSVMTTNRGDGRIDVTWNAAASGTYPVLAYELETNRNNRCPTVRTGPSFTHTTIVCTSTGSGTRVRVRAESPIGPGPWSIWSSHNRTQDRYTTR